MCVIRGHITSLTTTPAYQSLVVQVASTQGIGEPAAHRSRFLTHVFVSSGPALSVGDDIEMKGFFTLPPVTSHAGVPVRQILQGQGIHYEFDGSVQAAESTRSLAGFAARLPTRLAERTNLPTADCSVLSSLLFGGTTVPENAKLALKRAGLLHLLAASGANVLLIERCLLAIWGPICRKLPGARLIRLCGAQTMIWLFVALCGWQPSIVRAGLMSSYRGLGETFGRSGAALDRLLMAAYLMTLWQPAVWERPSTWLSYVATYAVSLALNGGGHGRKVPWPAGGKTPGGLSVRYLHRFGAGLWRLVRTTLVVEALTIPFTLHWFGQISIVAVFSNALAEPLIALLLPVILVLIILTCVTPNVAFLNAVLVYPIAHLADLAYLLLLRLCEGLSTWRSAFWSVASFTWLDAAAWYALLYMAMQTRVYLKRGRQSVIIQNRG